MKCEKKINKWFSCKTSKMHLQPSCIQLTIWANYLWQTINTDLHKNEIELWINRFDVPSIQTHINIGLQAQRL